MGFGTRRLVYIITGTEQLTPLMHKITGQALTMQQKMGMVGTAMSKAITVPVLAGGVAAVKLATDFQSSMAKIRGLVGASQAQVNTWSKQILDLAKTLPQSPKELADALYFVTSSGISGSKAMEVLKASARAAAAGLGSTADVADAVTSALNAYRGTGLSAARTTDILTGAVRLGKAEATDFAQSIGRVIPIASQMNVRFDEVSAAMASMTLTGLNAAEAATAVRRVLAEILHPSKEAMDTLLDLGFSIKKVRGYLAEHGLNATLLELKKRIGGNKDAMGKIFPNIRGLTGFLALTGKNAKQDTKIFRELAHTTGDTNKAFKVASETAAFKFKSALSSLQVAAIQLGTTLLPVALGIVHAGIKIIEVFSGLPSPVKNTILVMLGMAAVIGPILVITAKLWELRKAYVEIKTAILAMRVVQSGAWITIIAGIGPYLLIIAAVAVAIYLIIKHFNTLKKVALTVWHFIQSAAMSVYGWLKSHSWAALFIPFVGMLVYLALNFKKVKQIALTVWNAIRIATVTAWHAIEAAARAAWIVIRPIWRALSTEAKIAWFVVREIALIVMAIIEAAAIYLWRYVLKPIFKSIAEGAKASWNTVRTIAVFVWHVIEAAAKFMWRYVLKPIFTSIADGAKSKWNLIKSIAITTWHVISLGARVMWAILKPVFKSTGDFFRTVFTGMKAIAKTVWDGITTFVRNAGNIIKVVIRAVWNVISTVFGFIVNGAAKAFGWLPGLGPKLKKAAAEFNAFRDRVNAALSGVKNRKATVTIGLGLPSGVSIPHGTKLVWGSGQRTAGRKRGGPLDGPGTTTSDSIPVWASRDEYIMRAKAHRKYGTHVMDAINAGRAVILGYAQGGPVSGLGVDVVTPRGADIRAIINSVSRYGFNAVGAFARKILASQAAQMVGFAGPGAGSGVGRWRGVVSAVLALLHQSQQWIGAVLTRIAHESGGNPFAVNRWDINWQMGHPSVGLMQVIAGTFRAYANGFRNKGPFMYGVSTNPFANIFAGINYALHRYGGLGIMTAPGGYFRGGPVRNAGSFDGGFGILRPGYNLMYNGTGRNEPLSASGGNTYILKIYPTPLAHPADIGREVVSAIKQYEKRSTAAWRK